MPTEIQKRLAANEEAQRAAARETYLAILHRANDPQPGDDEELKLAMTTLEIDQGQLEADLQAFRKYTSLSRRSLSAAQRQEIAQRGEERLSVAHNALRQLLADIIAEIRPMEFEAVFKRLNIAVAATGGNDHLARAATWQKHWTVAIQAQYDTQNELSADDGIKSELAQLRRDHPRVFDPVPGHPTPAPAPGPIVFPAASQSFSVPTAGDHFISEEDFEAARRREVIETTTAFNAAQPRQAVAAATITSDQA